MDWHVTSHLYTPAAGARQGHYGAFGTPTAWFDGQNRHSGSGGVATVYRDRSEARLALDSPLIVTANVDISGSSATVTVNVELAPGESLPNPENYVVRTLLYENDVVRCCDTTGNDTFQHVGRALSDAQTLSLARGAQVHTLSLDAGWNAANLQAVAFVQEGDAGEILQAARATQPTAVDSTSWARIKASYRP